MAIIMPGGGSGPMPTKPSPGTLTNRDVICNDFEANDKIRQYHFCFGEPAPYEKNQRAPWFHHGEDVEKTDKCSSCKEEIPKNLYMMAKVNNVKY